MKRVMVVSFLLLILVSVKVYAWKGILGCCCCCEEEVEEMKRPLVMVGGVQRQVVVGGYQREQEVMDRPSASINKPIAAIEEEIKEISGNRVRISGESSNRVRINGEIVNNIYIIYGGELTGRGTVSNIVVEIINGEIRNTVYGGHVYGIGTVRDNVVRISNADVKIDVCGGRYLSKRGEVNKRGEVKNNVVEINSASVGKNVYGGSASEGDHSEGGSSTVVSGNIVRIVGGKVGGSVYGGSVKLFEGSEGVVSGNKVRIEGTRVEGSVYGGNMSEDNSKRNRGRVEYNEVELINADVVGHVHGGNIERGTSAEKIIRGNRVMIDGGRVGGCVCGNVVELKGSPKFGGEKTWIYGGREGSLNMETQEQIVVDGIKYFESYNFKRVKVNEPSKIKVVGKGKYGSICFPPGAHKVDLTKVRVLGKVEGEVKEGDRVNLIEAEEGVTEAERIELYKESGLIKLNHERVGTEKELSLEIKGQEATPQAQKLNEVGATGMIVVGQGLGFLTEKGIEEAVGSVKGKKGVEVFGAVEGESNKYKRGLEMRIEGVRAVCGVAKSIEEGKVVVGGYVEHGKGNYKVEEVEGKGMTSYVGIGGLARARIGEEVYMDVSMGVGSQGVEFGSKGMNVLTKEEEIGYDYRSMYVGWHVGCGYKREVGEKLNIDIVGKLIMMNQGSKEVEMTNGVPIEFERVVSGKIKGIAKAGYKCREKVKPYVGIGYEYELVGSARGKVEGVELKEVDIKGGSGIGEIGIGGEIGEMRIDVRGTGSIGKREGVECMLKVGYAI